MLRQYRGCRNELKKCDQTETLSSFPLDLSQSDSSVSHILRDCSHGKKENKQQIINLLSIDKLKFLCKTPINKEIKGIEECDCKMVTKGSKGCGETCLNRQTFMECPQTCPLGNHCSNKRFQVHSLIQLRY